jgi:hypothetical protein
MPTSDPHQSAASGPVPRPGLSFDRFHHLPSYRAAAEWISTRV